MRNVIITLAIVASLASTLIAQDTEPEGKAGPDLYLPFSANGTEVSFFFSITPFFHFAFDAYRAGEVAFEYNLLRKLKIEAGTEAAKALERATLLAQAELTNHLDLRPLVGNSEEYNRRQEESQRNEVRQITFIFSSMLAQLQASGSDPMVVIEFINREIRPGTSLSSDKPDFLESEELFRIVDDEFALKINGKELDIR